jgi:hypothetical protein
MDHNRVDRAVMCHIHASRGCMILGYRSCDMGCQPHSDWRRFEMDRAQYPVTDRVCVACYYHSSVCGCRYSLSIFRDFCFNFLYVEDIGEAYT